LISDYAITYSKFGTSTFASVFIKISFNENRTTFASTRHVPWALNMPKKCLSAANAFLAYLEPKERVCYRWLQMSFSPLGELTALHKSLS